MKRAFKTIFLFALIHFIVCLIAKTFGVYDELLLTLLTMVMSVILSYNLKMSYVFTIVFLILVNFLGVLLGKFFGTEVRIVLNLLHLKTTIITSPLSTFLTTFVIGYVQVLLALLMKKTGLLVSSERITTSWLLIVFVSLMLVRMVVILMNSVEKMEDNIVLNVVFDYVLSSIVIAYIASFAIKLDRQYLKEREMKSQAEFSYLKLKQQIEPHFLFNTLNTLDGLVSSGAQEQASLFIHKLSSIYRYMLENESENIIYLKEEIQFLCKYIDLQKVRFQDGFEVRIDIDNKYYFRSVVPCSLQILVENALKHNVIKQDQKLIVDIGIEDDYLVVNNIINRKNTAQESTGYGLKYLNNQYLASAGRPVIILDDGQKFTVKLPLI